MLFEIAMRLSQLRFSVAALLCCFLFALAPASVLSAAAKKKEAPPPDMRKLIKTVDVAGGAVVIEYMNNHQLHTYKIDDFTQLKVNGVPGKIVDIKAGMEVKDYVERDNDDLDGLTLVGYGEDPAAKKPAKKK